MADKERDIITSEGGSQGGAALKRNAFFGKDVWMCIVVLAAIALVAGVLLGLVNWLTYVDPDQAIREQLAGYYGVGADEVVALPDAVTEGSSYVAAAYAVNTAEGAVTVYHSVGSGAKGGTLELLVHIGEDGVITDIEVYAQSETAGYMDRVISANKNKYVGKNVFETGEFDLVKGESSVADAGDVDAVSQATFTSRGLNNAVNAAVASFLANAPAEVNV